MGITLKKQEMGPPARQEPGHPVGVVARNNVAMGAIEKNKKRKR
jgi:hypothetical protein